MKDPKKREAFASLFKPRAHNAKRTSIRPPYAKDKALFDTHCLTCKELFCLEACEENIIVLDEEKKPCLLFTQSGCTFCEECAKACPFGVLDSVAPRVIYAKFSIDTKTCLAWNGVVCRSCADACDVKAIPFLGMFRPIIEMDTCTRCGFCYGICPVNAVQYQAS